MKSRRPLILVTLAIIAGGFAWSHLVKTMLQRQAPPTAEILPTDPVPDFALTESRGTPITRADLLGKVWVANLMFTSCGEACPKLSTTMGQLDRALGSRDDVHLVSITITPEYDQPAVLREYAERFQASAKWLFLTGQRATITKLANDGFWLSAGSPGTVSHSEKFVLVDREGRVRGFFDGNLPETVPQLVKAIGDLTKAK